MKKRWLFSFAFLAAFPANCLDAAACTPGGPNTVCVITTGTTSNPTSATVGSVTYAWDSATAGPKTQVLFNTCGGGTIGNGFTFTVKDELGTAAANPISVIPFGADTIDETYVTTKPFLINSNYQSNTFQCDGNGNWVVE
jgi:hypothetical protein